MKRAFDSNVRGQGNKTAVLLLIFKEVICNPATNLKFLEVIFIEVLTLQKTRTLY
jgi:hypothetical protein